MRFASDFGIVKGGTPLAVLSPNVKQKKLPLSASAWLRTPYIHEDLSSKTALVMEYVPSIKITDDIKLNQAGVTRPDREYLSKLLARCYLHQLCVQGFFSTDPHPGNLGVEVLSFSLMLTSTSATEDNKR